MKEISLIHSANRTIEEFVLIETTGEPSALGDQPDWAAIEQSEAFRGLVRAKMAFILPATVFFVAYYFALPVLVGYFPRVMEHKVIGNINAAYLFALSEFAMAWIIMALYVRRARAFDSQEKRVLDEVAGVHEIAGAE